MIKAILSFSLSFLMLFGSVGFTVNGHICQGQLKTIGVFTEAPGCGQAEMQNCTASHTHDGINQQPCCSALKCINQVSSFESKPNLVAQETAFNKVIFDNYSERVHVLPYQLRTYLFRNYTPPEDDHSELIVRNQVFLI